MSEKLSSGTNKHKINKRVHFDTIDAFSADVFDEVVSLTICPVYGFQTNTSVEVIIQI